MPGVCDSCGDEVAELAAVHRIYVVPAADGTEEQVQKVRDIEHWCFPCRTHYPHEEIVSD